MEPANAQVQPLIQEEPTGPGAAKPVRPNSCGPGATATEARMPQMPQSPRLKTREAAAVKSLHWRAAPLAATTEKTMQQ